MALVACRECGEQISTEAKLCPKCGVTKPQPKSKKTGIGTWLVVIFLALGVGPLLIAAFNADPTASPATSAKAETPEQKLAREARDKQIVVAMTAAKTIKNNLRDPDSLKWEDARANADGSVLCLEYRAKNGFGGMNRTKAAYLNGKYTETTNAWNKNCTKPLIDVSYFVKNPD